MAGALLPRSIYTAEKCYPRVESKHRYICTVTHTDTDTHMHIHVDIAKGLWNIRSDCVCVCIQKGVCVLFVYGQRSGTDRFFAGSASDALCL